MLALAKVLIRRPKLLLLDEPSIGLAPTIVEDMQRIVSDINRDGISVLVAEQNVRWVAPLATRAFLLEGGSSWRRERLKRSSIKSESSRIFSEGRPWNQQRLRLCMRESVSAKGIHSRQID